MEKESLTNQAFNDRLKQWIGKNIKIFKHEAGDDDETFLVLQSITHADHPGTIDDYIPAHTLQLNGTGEVENEDNQLEPLPSSVYEIPIEPSTTYQFNGKQFTLSTNRGIYMIEQTKEI